MDRKSEYSELLRDPRWQRLRLQVFERDGWACLNCGAKDKTLAVHHKWYTRGKKPWEYPLQTFATLCEDCHEDEYKFRSQVESLLLDHLREFCFVKDILNLIEFIVAEGGKKRPGATDEEGSTNIGS